jgi:hypothetical protein
MGMVEYLQLHQHPKSTALVLLVLSQITAQSPFGALSEALMEAQPDGL